MTSATARILPAVLRAVVLLLLAAAVPLRAGATVLELDEAALEALDPSRSFQLGIDREVDGGFPELARRRVAAVVHPASVDSRGVPTLQHLLDAPGFTLVRVFHVEPPGMEVPLFWWELLEEARSRGVELVALTPGSFSPERAHLRNVNMVAWDVPLPGGRFELETAALAAMLELSSLAGVRVVLFDRPLLGSNSYVEGPLAEVGYLGSRQAFFPTLLYPGLTPGELAAFFNGQYSIQGDLRVVPMRNWRRSDGNRWMHEPPELMTDAAGRRVFEQLLDAGYGVPGFAALRALPAIAGEEIWESVRATVDEEGRPALYLRAADFPVVTMLERLEGSPVPGLAASVHAPREEGGTAELLLTVTEPEALSPFEAGLRLRAAAIPSIRAEPAPEDNGVFATAAPFEPLSRGLGPQQARRRWAGTGAFATHLRLRERYLVYPQ